MCGATPGTSIAGGTELGGQAPVEWRRHASRFAVKAKHAGLGRIGR